MNNSIKASLLIKILKDRPHDISIEDLRVLTKAIDKGYMDKGVIRKTTLEVLDLVEGGMFKSTADQGVLGWLNAKSNASRQDSFWASFKKSSVKSKGKRIRVLAEGDSWFNHPFLLDILEALNLEKDLTVYSQAYASDWLQNYIYGGEYVEGISLINPDVFLVSGGGNDMLEGKKIGLFINKEDRTGIEGKGESYYEELKKSFPTNEYQLLEGYKFISKRFLSQIKLMMWSYYFMFYNIRKKYKNLHIFTQGYANALPQYDAINPPFSVNYWYKFLLNSFQKNGNWLENPLKNTHSSLLEGEQAYKKRYVVKAMIHIFNESLIELVTQSGFGKLYHIDSRDLASNKDWFDEIHLKSYRFYQIARVLSHSIQNSDKIKQPVINVKKSFEENKLMGSFEELFSSLLFTDKMRKLAIGTVFASLIFFIIWVFNGGFSWRYLFLPLIPLTVSFLRRMVISISIVMNLKRYLYFLMY